ncbi:MAG: IS701 family transposase [Chloroflexota bacterium]|nr:IS701 family transposase [Chloroflexota bacterium]
MCGSELTRATATAQVVDGVLDLLRRQVRRPEAAHHVTDDLRAYVAAELGDPTGILVVDETGFPKQGTHSVGVARQDCGTLGKIGNCQIGVFLGYASPQGHAAIDRAPYLPKVWLADPPRGNQAGIPAETPFRTKPQLALAMLERARDASVPAAWVVADAVYGSDGALRRALEARNQAYVLAVRVNQPLSTWPPYGPPAQTTVSEQAAAVAAAAWSRVSCGEGAQGPCVYDWAYQPLRPALNDGWVHGLLIRRHPQRPAEIAWYLVYAPVDAPLDDLVRAAGTRWTIEEVFKLAKGQVGLDQYEVRSWQGRHRHITLALLALAALATAAKKGGLLRPPHSLHDPRTPASARSPRLERYSCGGPGLCLITLAPSPPTGRPGIPPPPPPEPAQGTVILSRLAIMILLP